MQDLTFRRAAPPDTERIAQIMYGEPPPEAVGLASGSLELASAFGTALVRLPGSPQGWEHTVLAISGGEVVGVLQAGGNSTPFMSLVRPSLLLRLIRTFGVFRLLTSLPRLRARLRLDFDYPPGAYIIRELHVDPTYRNRGVGSAMLSYAEEDARRRGYRAMSLTTTTANPARRLYERHGFHIAETRTDPAYERHTGIAGRHLMVKELT